MTEVTITREDNGSKARYVAAVAGSDEVAELTLSKASDKLIIVDHTGVPDALRGRGFAAALADRIIEDARAAGQSILPLCPFFKAHAMRHRDRAAGVVQI